MAKSKDAKSTAIDTAQPQENWNYEATVAKVEAIINKIESGKLELAEVFDEFTAATQYLQQCETFHAQRQQQMDLLIETLADGPESF